MKSLIKGNLIYLLYFFLLLIVTFRTSETAPNSIIRFGFLFLFFVPIVVKYTKLFPACLVCFMTIGTYGFSYNFFPYAMDVYPMICLLAILCARSTHKITIYRNGLPVLFSLFLIMVVNVCDSGNPQYIFSSLLTMVLCGILIGDKDIDSVDSMMLSFTIASLSLVIIFFLNYNRFISDYNSAEGLERSGWTDPNYLSCILGMGLLTAIIQLMTNRNAILIKKIFWIGTSIIIFIAQLLLASRGGILATIGALCVLLFFANISRNYKFIFLGVGFLLAVTLYVAGYFDLFLYRVENDDGTGSGRLDIWIGKLQAFADQTNPLIWLFGMGYDSAFRLAAWGIWGTTIVGFHNDYIALLCGYGIVGLILFIWYLLYPFIIAPRPAKPVVLSMLSYIVLACCTLEPFSAGRLTYYGFYFLMYIYAVYAKNHYSEGGVL